MDSGAAGHDNGDMLGIIGDADMIAVADDLEPTRPSFHDSAPRPRSKSRKGNSRLLKKIILDVEFAETIPS